MQTVPPVTGTTALFARTSDGAKLIEEISLPAGDPHGKTRRYPNQSALIAVRLSATAEALPGAPGVTPATVNARTSPPARREFGACRESYSRTGVIGVNPAPELRR